MIARCARWGGCEILILDYRIRNGEKQAFIVLLEPVLVYSHNNYTKSWMPIEEIEISAI